MLKYFFCCKFDLPMSAAVAGASTNGIIALSVRFLTPLRVVYQRKFVFDIEFEMLVTSLLRRLRLLGYFHCDQGEGAGDHKAFIGQADRIERVHNGLVWRDRERCSGRQQTRMKMGGLVGDVVYRGDIGPLRPLLEAGAILHVGKGTSFGLGKYVLRDEAFQE